jgi:hypothetical protein
LDVFVTARVLSLLLVSNSLFVFSSQVHDDDLWNYFEHVGDVKEGNALYNYTKQKAFDTMDKVLEMRLSSNGYVTFSCFLVFTFSYLFTTRPRLLLKILFMSHIG